MIVPIFTILITYQLPEFTERDAATVWKDEMFQKKKKNCDFFAVSFNFFCTFTSADAEVAFWGEEEEEKTAMHPQGQVLTLTVGCSLVCSIGNMTIN